MDLGVRAPSPKPALEKTTGAFAAPAPEKQGGSQWPSLQRISKWLRAWGFQGLGLRLSAGDSDLQGLHVGLRLGLGRSEPLLYPSAQCGTGPIRVC